MNREAIRRIYADHPLREARIIARLRRDGADLEHLGERDLAEDPRSGTTDQNHIGGRTLALALAARAGIDGGMRVLDLCAGLAGTARVLADAVGCRVVALDLVRERCRDARSLTERVRLTHWVTVVQGDACALPFAPSAFDAVLGQSSWSHITHKPRLLAEAARVLRPNGVLAFEDAVLGPAAAAHAAELLPLAQYWCFDLEDAATWRAHLEARGLEVLACDDLTQELAHEARRIRDYLRHQYRERAPSEHAERWSDVVRLAEEGALGYVRFVAVRRRQV